MAFNYGQVQVEEFEILLLLIRPSTVLARGRVDGTVIVPLQRDVRRHERATSRHHMASQFNG